MALELLHMKLNLFLLQSISANNIEGYRESIFLPLQRLLENFNYIWTHIIFLLHRAVLENWREQGTFPRCFSFRFISQLFTRWFSLTLSQGGSFLVREHNKIWVKLKGTQGPQTVEGKSHVAHSNSSCHPCAQRLRNHTLSVLKYL